MLQNDTVSKAQEIISKLGAFCISLYEYMTRVILQFKGCD